MIVVVGLPAWSPGPPSSPAGRTADIAMAAAGDGARVEVMGRIGDDPAGDALLLALTRAGVGHVALLRDPARPTPLRRPPPIDAEELLATDLLDGRDGPPVADPRGPRLEPADVALGLAYITTFEVLVVADDAPSTVIPACVEAAAFAGARLVVAVPPRAGVPEGLPGDATVLVAPDEDGEAFARLLGRYAASLDRGAAPEAAFAVATGDGWAHPGG